MLRYVAPTRDISFILNDILRVSEVLGRDQSLSPDLLNGVVEEAARLCERELTAINRGGDEIGCRLEGDNVRTPPGFGEAFQRFASGGWIGLTLDSADGGQGLPEVLNVALHEMIMSACLSFGDYIGLPQAAAKTLSRHASADLRAAYLPGLASGECGASMCLTEPACGTDLGLISTAASPSSDGEFTLRGAKIFISGGDQDITENIVHLVLARIAGAPAGVKGLSLFACPKFIPDAHARLGARNSVRPVRLENKMGYHGIATCEMAFEDARAWLVGEPNRGLAAMFTMVNTARLLVALQGLGTAEAAYQNAASYARERQQGRALTGARYPELKADPLVVHPDVRRILLKARAFTEAGRALALWLGLQIDLAERAPSAEAREEAGDLAALLTPVIKSSFSDLGFDVANACMQVWGGHGYIRDNGMEQLVRDCRIAQIQEGANGVQALDLIGRKLSQNDGRLWRSFEALVRDDIRTAGENPVIGNFALALSDAIDALSRATEEVLRRAQQDRNEIGAAGVEYQHGFALVALGWMWFRLAAASVDRRDDKFFASKIAVAQYFFAREMPKLKGHLEAALSGASVLMALADNEI